MTRAISILITLAALSTTAYAVPQTFTFAGRLSDGAGPVGGPVTLELALYDSNSGGTQLWAEAHATQGQAGLVSVAVGSVTPLDPADFRTGTLWLAVTVNGTVLSPRTAIRSVPYALRAGAAETAETLGTLTPTDVQHVLGSGCSAGSAIRDISPAGVVTCEAIPVAAGVPAGAISFFEGTCPAGWSDYAALNGRVPVGATIALGTPVGTALANLGTRTIAQVPTHTHTADPGQASTSSDGSHVHGVDPAAFATASGGAHSHTIIMGSGGGTSYRPAWSGTVQPGIGDYNATGGSHVHTVDVPSTTSSSAGSHAHTINLPAFSTGATGVASVDVTMPYLQLRACRKD